MDLSDKLDEAHFLERLLKRAKKIDPPKEIKELYQRCISNLEEKKMVSRVAQRSFYAFPSQCNSLFQKR